MIFGNRKVESLSYRMVKKIAEKFNRLSRVHQRHRQTDDRQQTTDGRLIAYSERNVVRSLKSAIQNMKLKNLKKIKNFPAVDEHTDRAYAGLKNLNVKIHNSSLSGRNLCFFAVSGPTSIRQLPVSIATSIVHSKLDYTASLSTVNTLRPLLLVLSLKLVLSSLITPILRSLHWLSH